MDLTEANLIAHKPQSCKYFVVLSIWFCCWGCSVRPDDTTGIRTPACEEQRAVLASNLASVKKTGCRELSIRAAGFRFPRGVRSEDVFLLAEGLMSDSRSEVDKWMAKGEEFSETTTDPECIGAFLDILSWGTMMPVQEDEYGTLFGGYELELEFALADGRTLTCRSVFSVFDLRFGDGSALTFYGLTNDILLGAVTTFLLERIGQDVIFMCDPRFIGARRAIVAKSFYEEECKRVGSERPAGSTHTGS